MTHGSHRVEDSQNTVNMGHIQMYASQAQNVLSTLELNIRLKQDKEK